MIDCRPARPGGKTASRVTTPLLVLVFLAVLTAPALAGPVLPDTIVLSPQVLYEARQRILRRDPAVKPAYEQLLREADRALKSPVRSVADKPLVGRGRDRLDYVSLSPYWWPDPEQRDGLPYLRRDGERNPEADSDAYDRKRMARMAADVETLALAHYLGGNELYAIKAAAMLRAWFIDRTTRMNPNMEHAQLRPGTADGSPTGIIETRDLIRVADAARLLEPSRAWTRVDARKLSEWFAAYTDWLMHSDKGREEAQAENNHGTWFDAQVAVFATFSGDVQLARAVVGTAERRRIVRQILPGGSMPRELKRTRSRHYTFFNLEAFAVLAAVGEGLHVDLWNWRDTVGSSIREALDFAAPYLDPEKEWPHGSAGDFRPEEHIRLLRRAALVFKDEKYLDFLKDLPPETLGIHRSTLCH